MSELTLLVLRFGFLLLLWMFVFAIVYALRSDLFGAPVRRMRKRSEGRESSASMSSAPPVTPSGGAMPSALGGVSAGARGLTGRASKLVITSGSSAGTELVLDENPITIGRSSDSTLVILDEFTSTQHARLVPAGDTWTLFDLDSTNGTKLAGVKVTDPVIVPLNTPVAIGKTTFELRV